MTDNEYSKARKAAVDALIYWAKTGMREFTMRDAVNDYLEASGANRPSIGGEETILAHRKIAANRLAIDCIYNYNSCCNMIAYFPSFPSVLLDEFVFVVAVFDEVARGRRVGLEPIDQRLFFGCDGGTFVFVRLVSFRFCSAFLFSSALLLAFSRSKAMRLRSLIS